MTKRLIPLLFLIAACSSGEGDESPGSFSASFGNTPAGDGDGDGETDDGDGDPTPPGDGDGDPTPPGDGDGDPTGDGDGDGDGDVDPCPLICAGAADSTPNTCDAPYFIGRTAAKDGFFYGGSTLSATDDDNESCGPNDDPSNWDSGHDHFFRIWLVEGDTISVTQNPNGWDARLKVHDEAECIGNAKECTMDADPAILEYEAPKTDWFTLVADGQSIAFDDFGDYTLTLDLVPGLNLDECACP